MMITLVAFQSFAKVTMKIWREKSSMPLEMVVKFVMTTLILIQQVTCVLLMNVIASLNSSMSMDLANLAMLSSILIQTVLVPHTEAALLMSVLMVLTILCNGVTNRLAEPTPNQITRTAMMLELVFGMNATGTLKS
jgi:hypothetical protein